MHEFISARASRFPVMRKFIIYISEETGRREEESEEENKESGREKERWIVIYSSMPPWVASRAERVRESF